MTTITTAAMKMIDAHFMRPCEFTERGEIVYRDGDFRVGYIADGEYEGWLVDTTGDSDQLIRKVA